MSRQSLYFDDGRRKIHFVLVYKISNLNYEGRLTKLETFFQNLKRINIQAEIAKFSVNEDVVFVKIHVADSLVLKYAPLVNIDLARNRIGFNTKTKWLIQLKGTPLTNPELNTEIKERTNIFEPLTEITTAERIMVVHEILNRLKFGTGYDFGLDKMIRHQIFTYAFPMHDGPYEWTESGQLNDRQLLAEYWGNFRCWRSEQPLFLIEKYFGSEYAFYFAWLDFYVTMLLPIGVLSFLCLIYGLITIKTSLNITSIEICKSNMVMCPKCHYFKCRYELLKNSCLESYLTYLFDNPATIAFSILVSVWSTIFMERWQRYWAVLQMKWNVKYLEDDISVRFEYVEKANSMRFSKVTQTEEPYITKDVIFFNYTITIISVIFLLTLMASAVIGVILYRLAVNNLLIRGGKEKIIEKNTHLIASVTGAIISTVFIGIFKMFYDKLAVWLTKIENHRSQVSFDNAYIFKNYALAFTNNYAPVLYIAFLKGKFFTHPGDETNWSHFGGIRSDVCDPTGCILDLGIQLISIMFVKIVVSNIIQMTLPIISNKVKKFQLGISNTFHLTAYEEEYLMKPLEHFSLTQEYMDMVIQYGFVVFFVAGFPLAPALALVNNLLEIRVDASKIIKNYQRPIPRRVASLGAWFGILQAITYAGVVTNGIVIAFTSNFMSVFLFRMTISSSYGYINTSLSEFAVKDFIKHQLRSLDNTTNVCYYQGRRYPPHHEFRYQLTGDYWYMVAIRFALVIFFEHIVIVLKGILAYSIPDVPDSVTAELAKRERQIRESKKQKRGTVYQAGPSR